MTNVTRFLYAAALLAAAGIVSAYAQSQTPPPEQTRLPEQTPLPEQRAPVRFEVVSVKPNRSGGVLVLLGSGPGRYQMTNVPLRQLIQATFRLQSFQIVNAPDWTETERFDINAKLPEGIPLTSAVQQTMVEALLAERFKLVTHRETRELPVYALVLGAADGKVPPGLEPAPPECAPGGPWSGPGPDGRPRPLQPGQRKSCDTSAGSGSISAGSIAMESFAGVLSARIGRLVLNRTGLAGRFQFDLTYAPDLPPPLRPGQEPPSVDLNKPSLSTALQEQLGLKLESTRAPVEVLVIDSVDRPTPE